MAQLSKKIELYAEANSVSNIDFTKDVILEDIGDGPYIKEWNLDINQPTDSQLASYETTGNTAETNANIDITRQSQYGSWESQMEMIYKDQKNGTSTFKDHCDKVRSDNPKE
tara:strand:+ start:301 stop:636 length:336 start_codon:yes stop_codon:yes gene_type:complete